MFDEVTLSTNPVNPGLLIKNKINSQWGFRSVDIIFSVLHGPYGEDGTLQGLFELAGIPYVGSGVLSSAVSMDKVAMKKIFCENKLPVGPYVYFYQQEWDNDKKIIIRNIEKTIGFPCFVKPANLGSSIGISKAEDIDTLVNSIYTSLYYDNKVIVEAHIAGREIECSILGNYDPIASALGEIIPGNSFYDYDAKYNDVNTKLIIPAKLEKSLELKIKEISCLAFKAVEASSLARVDLFVDSNTDEVVLNEINTMPGFTKSSMYPKLWEESGINNYALIEKLIDLAQEKFSQRKSVMKNH